MLRDKTVILTGASSGLGAVLAQEFAAAGARLVLFARNGEKLQEVVGLCQAAGASALAVVGDVTRAEDCKRLIETSVEHYGSIDYLVANAGISMWARFDEIEDLTVFHKLIEVNYLGLVNCVHPALPHLKQSRGLIAAVSSIQGEIGVPLHTGYVASKHALEGFCKALRMELEGSGVDVLTVLPHWLRGTDLRQNAFDADGQALGASSRKHSSESIALESASQAILQGMIERRRKLVMPWKLRLLLGLYAVKPKWAEAIVMKAVNKQNK